MKKWFSFLFLFCSVFLVLSCTHQVKKIPRDVASLQKDGLEGIWFLQGSSTTRGPYNGELELRKAADGTYDVVRIITYINYFFDGLRVQEVWTGKAVPNHQAVVFSYDLRQADFIKRLGKTKRVTSDFENPINVIASFSASPAGLSSEFSDKKVSSYREWITTRRDLEAHPLWQNQRQQLNAQGAAVPVDVKKIIKDFKKKIEFDQQPLVKTNSSKRDFKNELAMVVIDPTDFEFYRKNKDIIRVVNKVTDEISITESVVKRNAYSPSLTDKAGSFDGNTKNFHVNEVGLVANAVLSADGKLLSYSALKNSSLYTGLYLSSQAMRYSVTKNPEALEQVKKSLRGLLTLIDITEDPKEFARTAMYFNPTRGLPEGWRQGRLQHANFSWLPAGDRSDLDGVIMGLYWASQVIPKTDAAMWVEMSQKAEALLELEVAKEQRYSLLGLAAVLTGKDLYKQQFNTAIPSIDRKDRLKEPFYFRGTADWSRSLGRWINLEVALQSAKLLGDQKAQEQLIDHLLTEWRTYEPAQRQHLSLTTYGLALNSNIESPLLKAGEKDRLRANLRQVVWALREMPYPRPNLDVEIDYSLRPDWTLSPIPARFWEQPDKTALQEGHYFKGLISYPYYEIQAFNGTFRWGESPFEFKSEHNKELEHLGVDYLYVYWLARYIGLDNLN